MEGIDFVLHQAALRITRCAEAPREALEVLVDGTYNVLEAAVEAKVKKLVFASSASVYGEPVTLPIHEEHPFNNRTAYGAGKIAGEHFLRVFKSIYNLDYMTLRYFNVYGPRMDIYGAYTEVMIRWLDRLDAGQPPLIYGNGSQSMDFIYVEDVARANLLALKCPVTDEVFNVASGVETSLNQLVTLILSITGAPLVPEYRSQECILVQRRRGSTEKAERVLGFKAQVSLEEGLRHLIAWRRKERGQS
jgi:UDP-glucose 4-epimerase